MLVIKENRNSYEIVTSNGLNKNHVNQYDHTNGTQLFSDKVTSSLDNLCNDMVEAFHKHEQMNDAKISKISESMLNKTIDAFHKTEQMNDNKIKQMIESFSDNEIDEEKFEHVESQMYDLSMMHQNMQMDFLKKKKDSLVT